MLFRESTTIILFEMDKILLSKYADIIYVVDFIGKIVLAPLNGTKPISLFIVTLSALETFQVNFTEFPDFICKGWILLIFRYSYQKYPN